MAKPAPLPQPPPPTIDSTVRMLRVVYAVLLVAMLLYVYISEASQHQLIDMNRKFLAGISVIAAILAGIALYVQLKVIRPALEILQSKPDAIASIARWRSASIASYVLGEAVVLFGLCLRFLGGVRAICFPFYIVGLALMLFMFPRRP